MQNQIKKPVITGDTIEALKVSMNKALTEIYNQEKELHKEVSSLTRGQQMTKDIPIGSLRLVEEKKGSKKFRIEAKYKGGIKVLDGVELVDRGKEEA